MVTDPQAQWLPDVLVAELQRRGYRIEVSDDGNEQRVMRPDGSVAIIARKNLSVSPDVVSKIEQQLVHEQFEHCPARVSSHDLFYGLSCELPAGHSGHHIVTMTRTHTWSTSDGSGE
jgi:ubiquitin C-terminal hydrolase